MIWRSGDQAFEPCMVQNPELELQYKSSYARVLDSKRRFLEAATRYYELSQTGAREVGGHMVRMLSSHPRLTWSRV